MAEIIRMPKMSDTMEEGVIASWLKKVGDTVKPGDILAEVETDKATMELESYEEGVLLYIGVNEKDSVPVNGIIAIIGEKGEDFQHLLKGSPAAPAKIQESIVAVDEPKKSEAPIEKIDTSSIHATVITMPKMSDTMHEGTIATWLKKVGDPVKSGEIIAEVETDKATMELESYEDGVLLYIGVEAGSSVAVDGVIAVIGEKGADFQTLLKANQTGSKIVASLEPAAEPAVPKAEPQVPVASPAPATSPVSASSGSSGDRLKASPLAKKIAADKGLDIRQVAGSGEGGRIVKKDVETFVPAAAPKPAAVAPVAVAHAPALGQESFREEKVSQMRKTIAKRLAESKYSAPHFYLTMEINMDKAIEARKSMNEFSPVKISFNDMVIKAAAAALRQHPKVNSSWLGDKIRYNDHIHIGMAVAVEEGLLVPVIRFADSLSLSQISNQAKTLGGKAKNKELQPKDWEGNTFTISNLGMFGIDEFTAIINPPDACILAVGGIKETVIVKDGQMKIGNVMKVTLSCDHRVVDGAVGSAFLQTLKGLLEDPVRILI
jgi:pyruvate dehydrogenase E2 component (dihydrolipoamide acetyltransferase)